MSKCGPKVGVTDMVARSRSVVAVHQQGLRLGWAQATYGGVGVLQWRASNELRFRPQGEASIFRFLLILQIFLRFSIFKR